MYIKTNSLASVREKQKKKRRKGLDPSNSIFSYWRNFQCVPTLNYKKRRVTGIVNFLWKLLSNNWSGYGLRYFQVNNGQRTDKKKKIKSQFEYRILLWSVLIWKLEDISIQRKLIYFIVKYQVVLQRVLYLLRCLRHTWLLDNENFSTYDKFPLFQANSHNRNKSYVKSL